MAACTIDSRRRRGARRWRSICRWRGSRHRVTTRRSCQRVLIVEDEAGPAADADRSAGQRGLRRSRPRATATRDSRARAGGALRSDRARRDAAADERLRRLPRSAPARGDDADPDADGARPGGRQGRRAEARRRRLPDEAVRDARADGASRGAAAAAAVGVRSRAATRTASATSVVDFRRDGSDAARGEPVDLSAREFKLLRHFIGHRGATRVARRACSTEVWGYDEMPLTRTVDVHVAGLRQKIESESQVAGVHAHRPRSRLQVFVG